MILGLLKANYALHLGVEGQRDVLAKRLNDRAQRHVDVEELGRLRKTMRKRYLEWLKHATTSPFAKERAQELQEQIGAILEERYGYDVRDRFITDDNADSTNPSRVLSESEEYAARVRRLRGIIRDIRRGWIRRRVLLH